MGYSLRHKVVSTLLSVLMFFASGGFSFDVHYCKGEVKSVGFLEKYDTCCNKILEKKCTTPSHKEDIAENSCCKDKNISVNSLDEIFVSSVHASVLEVSPVIVSKFHLKKFIHDSYLSYSGEYACYEAPLLDIDVNVFYQIFLI